MQENIIVREIDFKGFKIDEYQEVLTEEAKTFLLKLHDKFNQRRLGLLAEREIEQAFYDAGNYPSFPKETEKIPLKYFAYGFGVIEPNNFKTQSEFIRQINRKIRLLY